MVKILASEHVIAQIEQTADDPEKRAAFLDEFQEIKGSVWLSPGGFIVKSGSLIVSFVKKGQTALLINDVVDFADAITDHPEKLGVAYLAGGKGELQITFNF